MQCKLDPYLSHKYTVLISGVMKPHAPVAVISLPKMQDIVLISVLTALKGKYAAFLVVHLLFGESHNLCHHSKI